MHQPLTLTFRITLVQATEQEAMHRCSCRPIRAEVVLAWKAAATQRLSSPSSL